MSLLDLPFLFRVRLLISVYAMMILFCRQASDWNEKFLFELISCWNFGILIQMEWATLQHLDLRHVGREAKPLQPHAAAFHPHQALVAAAVGKYIIGNSSSPKLIC